MKQSLKQWGRLLTDPFGVQVYFILFSFLTEIPVAMAHVQFWKKVGLLWAAVVILYDLFTKRRCLKAHFALPVLGLLAAYAVTVVGVWVDHPAAFQETYLDWFCSAVTLLVLYPPTTEDREMGLQRLRVLNWLLVALTSVAALVGLGMFALQYGGYFHSDITNYDYPIGFVNRRLTGLYRNAIYPTALIGVMTAAVEWTLLRGRSVGRRVLLAVSVVVNVLHIVLANSRGITYSLALFAALLVFFLLRRRLSSRKLWLRWGASLAGAAVVASLLLGLAPVMRRAMAYVPPRLQSLTDTVQPPDAVETPSEDTIDGEVAPEDSEGVEPVDPMAPVDVDREVPEYYGALTGRPIIWRQGLEFFSENPWIGYGPYALKNDIRISETSSERLSHFHNIFVQSLVSVGVLGSIFFFVLLAGAVWRVLRGLLSGTPCRQYAVLVGLGAMLAALLFLNLADTTIFFLSKNSEFVFWSYLGYALLLADDKPLRLDAPVRWLDERLPCLLNRKGKEPANGSATHA